MSRIVQIFRQHGTVYLNRHAAHLLPSHRRTIHDVCNCRTPVMGGHVYQCRRCDYYRYSYHCCGNRHCPQCRQPATARWVQQRLEEVMPVAYFHLVFTLPAELRDLVRRHQKVAYGVLIQAAAASLMKLCADQRYLGAQVGILAVLHTWSRAMIYHPHVHLLVPGVGLSRDGRNVYFPRRAYLVPVKALSRIFRAKFVDRLKAALPEAAVPVVSRKKDWVVFCKHLDLGPEKAIAYLGRYLNRVAISEDRVSRLADGAVGVGYRDAQHRYTSARLTPEEFLRRYLQHVLPKNFHKVRRYGLFAPCNGSALAALRHQLLLGNPRAAPRAMRARQPAAARSYQRPRCPQCGHGLMPYALPPVYGHRSRSPPQQGVALQ
jgi:hypothetical protein